MIDIIFDQYQRYKNTQIIINSVRKNNETFRILEVGANEHKNLEKFLPNDEITYLDISLPDELLNDPKYILGDATNMDFKDGKYDIVVALDVYEHIPSDRRESFISELNRVSSKIAILSAPFNKKEVELAESRANTYYKSLIGLDHHWLYEHIDNKLPSISELEKYLEENGVKYKHFSHGNLNVWEKLTNIQALIQLDNSLSPYIVEVDKYYNSICFEKDYSECGYRDFFVFEKDREFKLKFEVTNEFNELNELIDNVYKLFNARAAMNLVKPVLIANGDNIIRMYMDYGNGFSEAETVFKQVDFSREQHVIFNGFDNRKINMLRIDPTEKAGKYRFGNVVIKTKNNEPIENINIVSNCIIMDGDIFVFINDDPQICLQFEGTEIESIEFTVSVVKDYSTDAQMLQPYLLNKLSEVSEMEKENTKLLIASTEGMLKKVKKLIKNN